MFDGGGPVFPAAGRNNTEAGKTGFCSVDWWLDEGAVADRLNCENCYSQIVDICVRSKTSLL